ncbi:hypothetical protein B0H14DRAFT_2353482, partial [Mycena olivaceomarginata]
FSCTDDGCTGRSLSLVSRAVHIVSKPLKYQSLCVVGLDQLMKLLAVLSKLPTAAGGRKVKYLFIAGLDDAKKVGAPLHADPSRAGLAEKTLRRVLLLVAPSLVALYIHRTTITRHSLLPEIEFPLLTELTLHGPFKSSQSSTDVRPPIFFPSLRRLQICHFAYHPEGFLGCIVRAAPMLTHLRVPQSSFTPYEIQVALGILQPTTSAVEAVYLPTSFKELVIEVDPATSFVDLTWASNRRANQFLKKFRTIPTKDGRMCLVDGRSDWTPAGLAKKDWLEGCTGLCQERVE